MAAITGLVIAGAAVAASAYSANKQAGAAKAEGNDAQRAADEATQRSDVNYQRTQDNLNPYINAGNDALTKLNAVNGGDYSGFENSPDYLYARGQMQQGIERGAAARGSLYSGGESVDLSNALNGIASQNLGNYTSRLQGTAQLGQNSATGLGSIGTGNAAQAGSFGLAGAAAQGDGAINQANVNTNLVGNLSGILGQYLGQKGSVPANASSYSSPYSGQLNPSTPYTGTGSGLTGWAGMNSSWGS